jgi:hypothetical protein
VILISASWIAVVTRMGHCTSPTLLFSLFRKTSVFAEYNQILVNSAYYVSSRVSWMEDESFKRWMWSFRYASGRI